MPQTETDTVPERIKAHLARGPATAPQLTHALGKRYSHVSLSLRRLIKRGEVKQVKPELEDYTVPPFYYTLAERTDGEQ